MLESLLGCFAIFYVLQGALSLSRMELILGHETSNKSTRILVFRFLYRLYMNEFSMH